MALALWGLVFAAWSVGLMAGIGIGYWLGKGAKVGVILSP